MIYIDADFRCHVTNPDGDYREIAAPFFDGKCSTFVEGYLFVPSGETMIGSDGTEYQGEMATPVVDYRILQAAQAEYEKTQAEMADMQAALALLGVMVDE